MSGDRKPTLLKECLELLSGSLSKERRAHWAEALKNPDSPESKILADVRKRASKESVNDTAQRILWEDRLPPGDRGIGKG
jgi:hypothetical protein